MAEEVPSHDDAPLPPDGEPAETVSVYVSVYWWCISDVKYGGGVGVIPVLISLLRHC